MDIVTQALLGSAVAVSGARKPEIKHAAWIGAFAGILADADILIRSSSDPLLSLEFHRHFSHALIFIPVGALIAACMLWLVCQLRFMPALTFKRIYYYSFLGYMLSGVLDACTSYGTHLFWPFSDERTAWSIVSIVDPVFSGILLLTLAVAIKTGLANVVRIGLSLCVLYLTFSYSQSKLADEYITQTAANRGHEIERLVVKPTFGNVFLWRTVYMSEGIYYIDAVHVFFGNKIYQGDAVAALDIDEGFPELNKNSLQHDDILRFNHFSNGFIVKVPGHPNIIGDIRYSIFPLSARPLWGIELDPDTPDSHAKYVTLRENNAEQRSSFINMVLGNASL